MDSVDNQHCSPIIFMLVIGCSQDFRRGFRVEPKDYSNDDHVQLRVRLYVHCTTWLRW